jgi:glycosyltransferase involved in cell wall biosynthesis
MYGADVGLLHSIKSIDRGKYYPIVVLPSDMPAEGMLTTALKALGVEYHIVPLGILRRKYLKIGALIPLAVELIRGIAYVRATARKRKVALVYVNTIVAVAGPIGGRLAGVPVLWHIREILAMPKPVRWTLYKTMSLCASRLVCISKAVRDSLLNEAPNLAAKSLVIYNAVTAATGDGSGSQAGLREEIGVAPTAPLVGMVGRITHWKGQEILAEAAGLLIKSHPDLHFVAVGSYFSDESHYLDGLKQRIEKLGLVGRFHLADYRSDVTSVYRALDIFVLPSIKPEPFGRVTVEAMTQGCPVIATNHGGTVELIEEGVTGMLVPPSNPEALAQAITLLLADKELRLRMGEAASAYAKEHFGLVRHGEQMAVVIDQLANPQASSGPPAADRRIA